MGRGVSRRFDPPQSWYEPPEPPEPCCAEGEDDHEHDSVACMAEQAEAAAEARAADREWETA